MLKKYQVICILCFFSSTSFLVAQCNYLAYEGFNYSPATALHGASGGAGWSQPWVIQSNNTTVPGYGVVAGNQAFGTLQVVGNQGTGGSDYLGAGRLFDVASGGAFDNYLLSWPAIGKPNKTIWFSVLLNKTGNDSDVLHSELNGAPDGWVTTSAFPHAGMGYYSLASNVGGQRRWSLRINNTIYPSTEPIVAGTPVLAVMSVTFGTGVHTINVYFNPSTIGGAAPVSPSISQTFTGDFYVRSLAFYSERLGGGDRVDEIRVASTYQCVTPNPSVLINIPPTAAFTATPSSGTTPLTVNLDPSASADIDGVIVNYEWNFGDGSPIFTSSTGTTFNHIYTTTGVLTAILKVTDDTGATHTTQQNITVSLPAGGGFSCQASPSLLRIADCGVANGRIQVEKNSVGFTHTLEANAGAMMPATGDYYNNLASGNYKLKTTGSGCYQEFNLTVPTDSSTCSGWTVKNCRTQIGMNLNFPTYYTTERPFKNLFRFNSGFYSTFLATPWITSNQYSAMPKDADGYPLQIPYTDGGGTQHIIKVVISDNAYYPQERLVVLYEGAGTINCTLTKENETPGRFEIVVNTNGQILFDILASTLNNHIRNIRVLRMSDETANLTTAPFHSNFLARIAPFKCIRFMNWMKTNGSVVTAWSQRTVANFYDQSDNNVAGVAYEYMVQMCNITQKDAWICIPHQADNAYIANLAQFFKNNLNPNLKVWVEYSNEVWNWGFEQSHWVTNNGPSNISYPRRYVERAMNVFTIFETEFGGTARLLRVLGTQQTNTFVGREILAHANPAKYDFLSPTGYFSYIGAPCGSSLSVSTTALDVINCSRTSFRSQYASIRQDYWNARMHHKQVVNYESGNHMTEFNPSVPYAQALRDAQTHPAIATLYNEVADSLRKWDSRMIMYFVLASRLGTSVDVFGHLDHIDQAGPYTTTAPKYQSIINQAAQSGNECLVIATVLPVEVIDFKGFIENEQAILKWRVASESAIKQYIIERSEDGVHFKILKSINAKNQTGSNYQIEDNTIVKGKIYYYRLISVEQDGQQNNNGIVTLKIPLQGTWAVNAYPNPSSDGLINLDIVSKNKETLSLNLYDITGRLISQQEHNFDNNNSISLNLPPTSGFYFLKIKYLGEEKYLKLVRQ